MPTTYATRLNPFLGPVKLYINKTLPVTCPVATQAATWTGWTNLGWKGEKGVNLDFKNKRADMKVEEFNAPVDAYLEEEGCTVSFSQKKVDVVDIANAISGATVTAGTSDYTNMISGGGQSQIQFFSVGMQGFSPDGKPLVLWIPRATAGDSLKLAFVKGDSEMPVEFIAYADTTQAAGQQLWKLYELDPAS